MEIFPRSPPCLCQRLALTEKFGCGVGLKLLMNPCEYKQLIAGSLGWGPEEAQVNAILGEPCLVRDPSVDFEDGYARPLGHA
jgi:hypothetical protein